MEIQKKNDRKSRNGSHGCMTVLVPGATFYFFQFFLKLFLNVNFKCIFNFLLQIVFEFLLEV